MPQGQKIEAAELDKLMKAAVACVRKGGSSGVMKADIDVALGNPGPYRVDNVVGSVVKSGDVFMTQRGRHARYLLASFKAKWESSKKSAAPAPANGKGKAKKAKEKKGKV